ncbi:MAG: LicD family protein [Clostridiales bacterium]|nr:LicD family protein [Clostridiales bacterium]
MSKEINNLEDLKLIELDIMKKIHKICTKNGLQYYLAFGSLIGAVRHNGFIPWDDDIDIYMMRNDYEKLCQIITDNEQSYQLKVFNSASSNKYYRNMTKICDSRTVLIEKKYKEKVELGVNVDVWPLDYSSNINFIAKLRSWHCIILHSLFFLQDIELEQTNLKRRLGIFIANLFGKPEAKISKCERLINKYSRKQSDKVICYSYDKYIPFDKDLFSRPILMRFEDAEFYIPNGYNEILSDIYGDYMTFPPESERNPKHDALAYWKESN